MSNITSFYDPLEHATQLPIWQQNTYILLSPNNFFYSKVHPFSYEDIQVYLEEIHTLKVQQIGALDEKNYTFIYLESKSPVTINCTDISNDYLYLGCNTLTNSVSNEFVDCLIVAIPKEKLFPFLVDPQKELFFYSIDQKFILREKDKEVLSSLLNKLKKNKDTKIDLKTLIETIASVVEKKEIEKNHFLSESYVFPKICQFILENYHVDDLKVSDICKQFRISRRTLQYMFENNLGIAPQLYLRYIRLNHAAYYLKFNSESSIQDIAFNVGMTHLSRFSKYFKDFYLVSPSNFKLREKRV